MLGAGGVFGIDSDSFESEFYGLIQRIGHHLQNIGKAFAAAELALGHDLRSRDRDIKMLKLWAKLPGLLDIASHGPGPSLEPHRLEHPQLRQLEVGVDVVALVAQCRKPELALEYAEFVQVNVEDGLLQFRQRYSSGLHTVTISNIDEINHRFICSKGLDLFYHSNVPPLKYLY